MKSFKVSLIICLLLIPLIPRVFALEYERPDDYVSIGDRVDTSYTDGQASIGLGVHIDSYYENDPSFNEYDVLSLRISATANTRVGITYEIGDVYSFFWYDVSTNNYYLEDGQSVEVILPFTLRFYGAWGSGEYTGIWHDIIVSGDGWIHLVNPSESIGNYYQYGHYSESIPSPVKPNSFIAPFWRDLKSGWIRTGEVLGPGNLHCFVITWENFEDENGNLQTFQVIIGRPYSASPHYQNVIWFSYKTITTDIPTTVGIEDQGGGKGASYNYKNLHNGMTLVVAQTSQCAFISRLTIKLEKSDPYAIVDIDQDPEWMRGYNVKLLNQQTDTEHKFAKALAGTAALLLTALAPEGSLIWAAGVMISRTLFVLSWVDALASLYAPADISSIQDLQDENWVKVYADGMPVDAGLGILVRWFFKDGNSRNHSIKITAQLEYFTYNYYFEQYYHQISTDLELKMNIDDNNSFDAAKEVLPGIHKGFYLGRNDTEDYFKVNVQFDQILEIYMYPPSDADFDLYLYDPSGQLKVESKTRRNGAVELVSVRAGTSGYWYFKVTRYSERGFYNFTVNAYYPKGHGCPTLFVWNGSHFVKEETLNIHSEPNVDVTVNYTLKTLPAVEHSMYILKLAEIAEGYNFSHSFIDYVKLYVVDGDGIWHPCHLTKAEHSTCGNVMRELLFSDDKRTETLKNEEIILKFHIPPIWTNSKTLIFQIEGHNPLKM
jgi:hypothetical protein